MGVLKVYLLSNIYKFDGMIYELTDVVPMGSPLAPPISDLTMDLLEKSSTPILIS